MTIITKQSLIDNIVPRWTAQYPDPSRTLFDGSVVGEIRVKLVTAKTEDEIAKIIGNKSWTRITCDQCGKDVSEAAVFHAAEHSVDLCKACISEAAKALGVPEEHD